MPATLQTEMAFPGPATTEARFWAYHQAHPRVFQLLEQLALVRYRAGLPHVRVKALFEEIRGQVAGRLDNTFTAHYARLLIARHPQLATVIETRARKAE